MVSKFAKLYPRCTSPRWYCRFIWNCGSGQALFQLMPCLAGHFEYAASRSDCNTTIDPEKSTPPDSLPVNSTAPHDPATLFAFYHVQLGLALGRTTGRLIADMASGAGRKSKTLR